MLRRCPVSHPAVALAERYGAHNYHPLDVVLVRGEGAWVWDADDKKYLDCLSAYSAVNQGHCHPRILAALVEQAQKLTLSSRAFHNDQLGPFLERLCTLTGFDRALPMNSGAEAVETAIKAARKWGYEVKGVPADQAEIIWFTDNFHGRTTTIVGFSSEAQYRRGFGPFGAGHRLVPYGDADAVAAAIGPNTVAVFAEPIQGEAGIIVPPDGFLRRLRDVCDEHRALLILDEIQTGLGRTGRMFAFEHEGIRPDAVTIGKALSGGFYPISAFLASDAVMGVFTPGDHGSTFGGNPLAAAVGKAALDVIVDEGLADRAAELGPWFVEELRGLGSPHVADVRGRGLLVGVEIKAASGRARPFCERLKERGVLCKETHDQVIRFAPPLVVTKDELAWALRQVAAVLA
jgi:ornithine--oxo-acid transaminase